ncbi:AP2 domain-containing protein [Sphingobium faniae]|nr:AP2 domain-containing protein [Sphingobium faniae]
MESVKLGPISKAIKSGKTYLDYVEECRHRRAQKPRARAFKPRGAYRKRSHPVLISVCKGIATFEANAQRQFIVDVTDIPLVSRLGVFSDGIRLIVKVGDRRTMLARILLDAPASSWVDHINGDPTDNRRDNLRLCNPQQNARNMGVRRDIGSLQSRFKGVCRIGKKWRAYIYLNKRQAHLGTFADEVMAARAYDAAARAHFGSFCCVNFPENGEQSAHRGEDK